MAMVQLSVKLPDMPEANECFLQGFLAAKLYERRILSLGQAADTAGLSKRAFAETLGMFGVSLFSQTADELEEDIANA
jgi:predicted HTH domain antitoxin